MNPPFLKKCYCCPVKNSLQGQQPIAQGNALGDCGHKLRPVRAKAFTLNAFALTGRISSVRQAVYCKPRFSESEIIPFVYRTSGLTSLNFSGHQKKMFFKERDILTKKKKAY